MYLCSILNTAKMKLITSDAILRKFTPNLLATVSGEPSFFEKLTPFIEMAEEWLKDTFTSEQTFNTIAGYTDTNVIKIFASKAVVSHAFMNAVPSLDLVLTPNGFGIVSNTNVAPASKERVERLIASLETERDRAIRLLLASLYGASKWTQSAQYAYFSATMFPNLDLCEFCGLNEHLWQKYQELRPAIVELERLIEERFIGKEQMDAFRQQIIASSVASSALAVQTVIRSIRAYIVQSLKECLAHNGCRTCGPTTLYDVVDIIRKNPDLFPLWHSSSIKELFNPPVFHNRKEYNGYWF